MGGEKSVMRRQPVAARLLHFAGEYFDAVAGGWLEIQRHDASVDLRAARAMADVGVHGVGEVEHGRAARQIDDLPLRCEQVDAVFENGGLESGEQRGFVVVVVLGFEQLTHPRNLAFEFLIAATAFLVAPVRGDALFGMRVHVVRTNLHFQRLAFGTDNGRMQRLIVIALRTRDVVVELARHRRPQRVHDAERRIARRHVAHEHAQCADVVQRREIVALALHFFPDRIDMLRAPGDIGGDVRRGQRGAQMIGRFADEGFALITAFVEQRGHAAIDIRMQIAEREIFQFPFQLPDAEPVGERRVDVGSELGQIALAFRRKFAGQTQRRQLPREKDKNDA